MTPHQHRDKLFASYGQGSITKTEGHLRIVALMQDVGDEEIACELCDDAPDWFRHSFRDWIIDLSKKDYYARWFAMGDTRSTEQVEADARQQQVFLKRVAHRLTELLANNA